MLTKITVKLTRVVCYGGGQQQRGGEGVEGNGKYIRMKLIHVDVWQKPIQYCKAISIQLNKLKKIMKLNRLGFQARWATDYE